ncbi:tyrosine-type recombinase/integrase [Spirosoma agri]|uniref:Tyrosine-type recombinase/integrase n=1 Tax=Spirosoma agri TaxID=1987381 RepID=A0A6M0IKQ8_9BACT|nr:tyrosine-type recombinase/integrase [Spirosoma agri]NEU67961.1 tyrosine-type recombinase/integrase [Spirosoma agri]
MPKPYKEPVLFNAKGDLTARWFVYYSYVNPYTGKLERIKVYNDINKFKTKKERVDFARLIIEGINEKLKNGYNPFAEQSEQMAGGVYTLKEAVDAYLTLKTEQLRSKTVTGYKSILKQFEKWASNRYLTDRPLREMSREDIRDYFNHARKERNISATTHNTDLTTIRAFFSYWKEEGLIGINPANGVKRLREEVATHVVYSDDDITKITHYLNESDTPRAKQLLQFIRFLYYTCIRPKEIRMLKIKDIRLATNTILIPALAAKSGRSEPVDISPGLLDVINSMDLTETNPDWYIFGNGGKGVAGDYADPRPGPKPVGVNYFSRYYREVLNELNFSEHHTMYAWKHTRNVHLYMQDKDLLRLMRHNRHTDPKITMKYLRGLGLLIDTRLNDERRI